MKPIDAWSRLIVREARGSMSQFIAKKCRTRLGPGSAGRLMTPEEFDSAPEWAWKKGYRYELIRDVLVVSPFLEAAIRDCNDHMGYWLRHYRDSDPRGSALDATLPEHIVYTNNRRWADRVVWTGLGRIPNPETEQPSIVIEFVSFRRRDALRDWEQKRDEYLAAGVKEYWIIDRFRRIMTVYRKGLAGPTSDVVMEAQSYQTGLLPGFVLPLSQLLARADSWSRAKRARRQREDTPKIPPAGGIDG